MKKNKKDWKKVSQEIYDLVGTNSNFESHYNCVTRMRFKIINKELVKEEKIKSISEVKGVVWNGDEIQIVIGADVGKVKQSIDFIIKNKFGKSANTKMSKKITQFMTGVLTPAWPVIMATGMIAGFQSLFVQFGWIQNPTSDLPVSQLDFFSFYMYISARIGLELLGVIFCYNVVNYLGGNPIMGIYLGLALTSRYFLGPGFGPEAGIMQHDGKGFVLFKLFGNNVYIKGYESSLLPMIFGGIFIYWFDKQVQKIIPGAVDIVFRPAIVFFVSFATTLFIIGPIAGLIEQLLGQMVIGVGKIPFGIGVGIVAMIWQFLVVTGTHIAVANVVKLPIMNGTGSSALAAMFGIAILAQFGGLIGVAIKTCDSKTRQGAIAAMPSICFGISEPAIYGTNLPKIKPFFAGCFAAFFGGCLSGILKLDADVIGGGGFLQALWFTDSILEMALYIVVLLFTISLATIFTILVYSEQRTPSKEIKKAFKKLNIKDKNLEFNIKELDLENKKLVNLLVSMNKKKNLDNAIENENNKQVIISKIKEENKNKLNEIIKYLKIEDSSKINLLSNSLNSNLIILNIEEPIADSFEKENKFLMKIKSKIKNK
ncbi:hypothetical protein mflW37_3170 [Mesoplasma florum W37]|uniref:PTS system sucrose-specific IIB component, PTS system sucrose-specific IIC component, PTS system sucrose-specific IIA component n=1 Tax=Mesoplasma florum TaxID=2151 RepID=A0AAD0MNZ4_MESFO|nr:PTS transporter subunit EIIC [Mesoplasma florum]AGY41384.1 hypothetical protein mflW37_3170 [Mesoplasma florum W37]AVN59607.1 hypothetical protein CG008_01655 [Mesoplasma florum]AVN65724.1 PTS system sucrose-specific IIB component, PTS system sucrose-specific IIC component, PTS system sucrose-specific IIA component [Mesoplasma florum]